MRKLSKSRSYPGAIAPTSKPEKRTKYEEILLYKLGGELPKAKNGFGNAFMTVYGGIAGMSKETGAGQLFNMILGPVVENWHDKNMKAHSMSYKYGVDTQKFGFTPYEDDLYNSYNTGQGLGTTISNIKSGIKGAKNMQNNMQNIDLNGYNQNTGTLDKTIVDTGNVNPQETQNPIQLETKNYWDLGNIGNQDYLKPFGDGGINFKSANAYKNWLAYGHASGEFAKTPGNQKVSIGGKPHKVKHAMGGYIEPQYEAEGGEVIQGNTPIVNNGGQAKNLASNMFLLKGNKHEQGGIEASNGDYIFSDSLTLSKDFLSDI